MPKLKRKLKHWSCPKKSRARQETILSQRKPIHQYWSMAGLCTTPNCELDQLLKANFIQSDQFHGVELLKDIYDANVTCHPNFYWHHGDFFQIMSRYEHFNPSLVNADLVQTIETASDYVSKILYLLTPFDCVLVANFIMEQRNKRSRHVYKTTVDDILVKLSRCQQFRYAMNHGWVCPSQCYLYGGTGSRSQTVMGTFVFKKQN